jgi:hypothetical protein
LDSTIGVAQIVLRGDAAPVVAELLPADSFGSKSVDLPGLAKLAAGSPVAGPPSFVVHGRLLPVLAVLPSGEISRAVKKRHDKYAHVPDVVLKPIFVHEQFANGRVVQFPNDSPTLCERRQAGANAQRIVENLYGRLRRVLCDVRDDGIEGVSCGFGPDYFTDPSSHLRRRSAATCS